jgi:hypothetical protein
MERLNEVKSLLNMCCYVYLIGVVLFYYNVLSVNYLK